MSLTLKKKRREEYELPSKCQGRGMQHRTKPIKAKAEYTELG